MKKTIIAALTLATLASSSFAAESKDVLKCPDDYDKIFMTYNVNTTKTMGFGSVYYCVLKGVLDTETGIKSIVKTIKKENNLTGDVTPIFFKVLKD